MIGGGKNRVVAVVTGAATGIGQAFAVRLAEDGAEVALLDVADPAETLGQVEQHGTRALAVACDVTDPDSVNAAAAVVSAGLGRATVLINVAGIYPNLPFADVTFDEWRSVLSVNLDAPFLLCKAFVPGMLEAGCGRIINVSSSVFGGTAPGFVPYIASKMGVIGLTRGLANDLGDANITVNSIAPGLTRTQHTSQMWEGTALFEMAAAAQAIKRTQEPSDLVGAMSFLTSDDAAFITGQTLVVDGGGVRV